MMKPKLIILIFIYCYCSVLGFAQNSRSAIIELSSDHTPYQRYQAIASEKILFHPGFKFVAFSAQYNFIAKIEKQGELKSTSASANYEKVSNTDVSDLKLYPNPVTDHLVVEKLIDFEASIFDVAGKNVLYIAKGNGSIDMSKLIPGVYMIRIKSADKTLFAKIIKK